MDTKDWMLIIGPLVGVVIGGMITSIGKYLELRSQKKLEVNKLKIQKIEELLLELGMFRIAISKCGETVQMALESGKRGDAVRQDYVPHYEIISLSFERIRWLQNVYVKSAQSTFKDLTANWNRTIDSLYRAATVEFSGVPLQESIFLLKEKTFELQREASGLLEPILKLDKPDS